MPLVMGYDLVTEPPARTRPFMSYVVCYKLEDDSLRLKNKQVLSINALQPKTI